MKKEKMNNGITLIALVVTIIILLILAGVTIGITTNGTGLFDKAKEARDKYQNSQENEEIQIAKYSNEIDSYITGSRDEYTTYSNSEQIVGKWIDNKTIYRKVVQYNNSVSNGSYNIEHGINNINEVVKGYCIAYCSVSSGEESYTESYIQPSQSTWFSVSNQYINYTSNGFAGDKLVFVIDYTKK